MCSQPAVRAYCDRDLRAVVPALLTQSLRDVEELKAERNLTRKLPVNSLANEFVPRNRHFFVVLNFPVRARPAATPIQCAKRGAASSGAKATAFCAYAIPFVRCVRLQ